MLFYCLFCAIVPDKIESQIVTTTYKLLNNRASNGGLLRCAVQNAQEITSRFFSVDTQGTCRFSRTRGSQYARTNQVSGDKSVVSNIRLFRKVV